MNNQVVDISVLTSLVGNDRSTIREFLQEYLALARTAAIKLRTSVGREDFLDARATAHKLKSSARSVGALSLGDLSEEIETLALAGQSEEVKKKMPEFDQIMSQVEEEVENLLQPLDGSSVR